MTPLASIIGSGFLVAGPILASTLGNMAWIGITTLCLIGYLYGEVIRFNIRNLEPQLEFAGKLTKTVEKTSDLALSIAYFISVAYYINLFAAFLLRTVGVSSDVAIKSIASVAIAGIGLVGLRGGLKSLERILLGAVSLKLALIGAISFGLVWLGIVNISAGQLTWPDIPHATGWNEIAILLGLVVLVQGFETSRYLGAEYSAATRIRSMRTSQLISSAIYIIFVLLITQFFDLLPKGAFGETDVIELLAPLGFIATPFLIIAALASQLSAGVADTNGSGGILNEVTRARLSVGLGSLITALVAIVITWSLDILQIIAIASKAFVFYYGLQSVQALTLAIRQRKLAYSILFGLAVLLATLIVTFATPASV